MNASAPNADDSRRLYAALAPIYDGWQSLGGATPFWSLALDRLEAEVRRHRRWRDDLSFADLGCGTGALLLALRERHPHWRLTGIDASDAMLAVARAKTVGDGVAWIERAWEDLDGSAAWTANPVAVAGAFHDTVNHLADQTAIQRAFNALGRRVLAPGGLFVFDVTNELGFRSWWTGNRTWKGDGWDMQIEFAFHPGDSGGGIGQAAVTIERDGKIIRANLSQRCFTEEAIRSALAQAGFSVECSVPWSPFDFDANGKTVFVASNSTIDSNGAP